MLPVLMRVFLWGMEMKKLGVNGQKWLKSIHIFFACLWIGGSLGLILMMIFLHPENGMQLYGIHLSMESVDYLIIAPGGIGSLLTGLVYSIFTNWGWFKHKWIIVKWCINLYGAILGTFWLGPWLNKMVEMVRLEGLAALTDIAYLHARTLSLSFGSFQFFTIIFALYLSVHKPWKKRKEER